MAKPQKKEEVAVKRVHRGVVYSAPKELKAMRSRISKEWFKALVEVNLEFQQRDPKYWVIPSRDNKNKE